MKNKRTVIKVKINKILKKNIAYFGFFDIINRSNKLVNIGYLFIRSFILYSIENNIMDIPKINIDFVRMAINVLSLETKKGRPYNKEKQRHLQLLKEFRDKFFEETSINYVDATNLSYILGQSYEQIYIAIINNILYHYEKHIWKYIKCKFQEEYELLKGNTLKRKELVTNLVKIKNDILSDGEISKSEGIFKKWINKNKSIILPNSYSVKKFDKDVKANTFEYLKCMYRMNKFIQTSDKKSYQIFPIRTSSYQKYIKINTSALIDIFSEEKGFYFKKSGDIETQEYLWNKYFNLKNPKTNKYKFRKKGYSFNYEIETDGYAVSLNFIDNDEIKKKEKLKKARKNGRMIINNMKKIAKTDKEYNTLKNKYRKEKEKVEKENKIKYAKRIKKAKEDFKKLSAKEQNRIKYEMNFKQEFPYIGKLTKNKKLVEKLKNDYYKGKLILCDPGKRSILYLMASNSTINKPKKKLKNNNFGVSIWKNRKIMNYTNKTRLKFNKRLKYGKLIDSWKSKKIDNKKIKKEIKNLNRRIRELDDKKNSNLIKCLKKDKETLKNLIKISSKTLKDLEEELSKLNSKSCNYVDFIKYVKKKNVYDNKLNYQYETAYLKKLNWFSYLNKRKHEDKLLNHIENEFGKDITIIIGDWSNNGNLKFISTPNLSIKRKLKERFNVFHIDEYLTSKIHFKHNVRCENLFVQNKSKNIRQKLHAVLSYKIDNLRSASKKSVMECINRDKNSVLNMDRLVKNILETGKRLDILSRKNNQIHLKRKKSKDVTLRGNDSDAKGAYRQSKKDSKMKKTEKEITKIMKSITKSKKFDITNTDLKKIIKKWKNN